MPELILNIGDRAYPLADLPPQALGPCSRIEFCERNIIRLQRELALLQQMRAIAVQALPSLLPDPEAERLEPSPKRRRYWPSAPACKPRRS